MKTLHTAQALALLVLCCAGVTAVAQDQQVNLPSLKDNTLYEDDFGTLSNGAGQHMFVGTNNRGLLRRALIAFDIAGNIPAGSTIQSVTLTLNMSQTISQSIDIDLLAVSQDWGEGTSIASAGEGAGANATSGDATWIHTSFDMQFWNVQGGNFVATPSATTTVTAIGAYSWTSAGMVTDVQGWLDQPSTNFGWILVATNLEHVLGYTKRFDTKENVDPTLRPVLSVTYTPPLQFNTANIPSLKDNTLYEDETGMLSNGAGPHMFVGTTHMDLVRRAVIAFDIAGNVPAGSAIQNVALTLYMDQTTGGPIDVDLWPVAQDWGEGTSIGEGEGGAATPGDATWIHTFFDNQFWNTLGGDYVDSLSATTTVDQAGAYTWSSAPMVSDVQGWLDQRTTNFGWGLVATNSEHVVLSAKRLGTKENPDPSAQPVLTVTYLPAQ